MLHDLDAASVVVLERLRKEAVGPLRRVTFPVAATDLDVAHGLDAVPNAFVVEYADGPVYARPGATWANRDVAYLRAANNNTHALVRFRVIPEESHA